MVEDADNGPGHPSCFSLQVGNDSRGNITEMTFQLLCANYSDTLFLNEPEANSATEIINIDIHEIDISTNFTTKLLWEIIKSSLNLPRIFDGGKRILLKVGNYFICQHRMQHTACKHRIMIYIL